MNKTQRQQKEKAAETLVSHNPSDTCIQPRAESKGSIQPWASDCVEFKDRPWYVEDWIKKQYL